MITLGAEPPVPFGCTFRVEEEHGYHICKIHASADPAKRDPKRIEEMRRNFPSERAYRQEIEIDFSAGAGALLYPEYTEALNVCKPFPIPLHWTKYMSIDPHKRRPHAMLWCAVDPNGDRWYYREYWPSRIYGKKGNVPEDDTLYHIDSYVAAIKMLEGEECDYFAQGGFCDNQGRRERIRWRIMDTHGKAIFSTTMDGRDEPETFWQRYEKCYQEAGLSPAKLIEAIKDIDAGRDRVGEGLRPRRVMLPDGESQESAIHIFETCVELRHELRTARFPMLSPTQVEKQDPVNKELQKRKHMIDNLRYLEMSEPCYIPPDRAVQSHRPVQSGISY